MSDELRTLLRRVDMSAPAIQGAAAAMMRHYDRSASVAVTEWRNALQTSSSEQILPMLYVVNEVLQTSKRNRGNKFLEAFSPILVQSLVFMAKNVQQASLVEKIRRTVKIWGDRRVFSIRFVNEILGGLEPYRPGNRLAVRETAIMEDGATFSPVSGPTASPSEESQPSVTKEKTPSPKREEPASHDEIMDILEAHDQPGGDEEEDDDDDDMFGDDSERQKLDIEINVDNINAVQTTGKPRLKRRRSSASGVTPGTSRRTTKVLSNTNMLEIWNQLAENQQKFELAQHSLKRTQDNLANITEEYLVNLVGDELQNAVQQNKADIRNAVTQRKLLHTLANERRALEQEALRYLIWLEKAIKHDEQDIAFTVTLEEKMKQFHPVHTELKKARDILRVEEKIKAEKRAEEERRRKEAEENERFRRAALAKETEAKPGMVWNPTTREYQALNTDESWRD